MANSVSYHRRSTSSFSCVLLVCILAIFSSGCIFSIDGEHVARQIDFRVESERPFTLHTKWRGETNSLWENSVQSLRQLDGEHYRIITPEIRFGRTVCFGLFETGTKNESQPYLYANSGTNRIGVLSVRDLWYLPSDESGEYFWRIE